MEEVINKFKNAKPKKMISKVKSISLAIEEGENDEIQEHTDGNDAGNTETDSSAS